MTVTVYWQPTSRARSSNGGRWHYKSACSYLHHQGEFHHNYCVVVTLHDSDHDGVVRISVDLSCVL